MQNYLLLIFPATIVILLFIKCTFKSNNSYSDGSWSISQSKSMQAIAALMIVLHHLVQTITDYGDDYFGPITEWNSFGIFFTSVFFFFSGFGLFKSYKSKEDYLNNFFRKRLPKIVIPFLITNILYFVTLSVDRVVEKRHIFTSVLGITLINTNAWFLVEIIILYIAFYFCFKKSSSENKALLYLSVFTCILVLFSLLLCHDTSRVNGHWFMGEWWYNTTHIFVFGLFVAKNEKKIKEFAYKNYKFLLPLSVILLVAWYILEEFILDTFGYYQEWTRHPGYSSKLLTLVVQMILCLIFICVLLLINLKVEFKNRILTFLSGISLEIYLIHDIFRQQMHKKDPMPAAEYFALVYVLTIVGAWLLSFVIKFAINYFDKNSTDFLTFRKYNYEDDLTYEGKKMLRSKRKIIRGIQVFYVFIFVGLIASEVCHLYDVTINDKKRFETELESLKNANVSDRVYFGKWILDYRKGTTEMIPWIVYDKTDDHMLLVSEYVLGNAYYNQYHASASWKESTLCRMLNMEFYRYAFTKDERKLLCGRKPAEGSAWSCDERTAYDYFINKDGEYDVEDVIVKNELVFVLTKDEVLQYMPTESDRITTSTEAAKDQGIGIMNTGYNAPWWIEDAAGNDYSAMYITINGTIDEKGKTINNTGMGVRPAIWITLK